MRDPMAGKYKRDYKLEFEIARVVLDGEPGELAWGVHDYEAMTFASADVRLIFYPHKTSAGNYHLRIRDQASKDKVHECPEPICRRSISDWARSLSLLA